MRYDGVPFRVRRTPTARDPDLWPYSSPTTEITGVHLSGSGLRSSTPKTSSCHPSQILRNVTAYPDVHWTWFAQNCACDRLPTLATGG
jgi:hypothetical protein